jgi:ParB/RepB/Spo0J family partition protein
MTKAKGKLSNLENTLSASQNILREAQELLEEESMRQELTVEGRKIGFSSSIRLEQIVGSLSLHHPSQRLDDFGYGFFEQMQESDKPALVKCTELDRLIDKFDEEIQQLANSIYRYGMMSPIVVCKSGQCPESYKVILGQRRILATYYNKLKYNQYNRQDFNAIPCIEVNLHDCCSAYYMILSENNNNRLDPISEANYYKKCKDEGIQIAEMADKTGIDHQRIRQRLQLLKLPEHDQDMVRHRMMSVRKALMITKMMI